MGGGNHLHPSIGKIKTAIGTPLHHPLEATPNVGGAKMAHLNPHAAIGGRMAFQNAVHDTAAHDIAGGALALRIIMVHEPLARIVEQPSTGTAQTLLEDGSGHARVIAGQ